MLSSDLSKSTFNLQCFGGWWEDDELSSDKSDVGILCEDITQQPVSERPTLGNGELTHKLLGSTYLIETSSTNEELDQVKSIDSNVVDKDLTDFPGNLVDKLLWDIHRTWEVHWTTLQEEISFSYGHSWHLVYKGEHGALQLFDN